MSGFVMGVEVDAGTEPSCAFCHAAGVEDGKHVFRDCLRARDVELVSGMGVARSAGCCYKCLEPGHVKRYCKEKVGCLSCRGAHPTIFQGRDPE